MDSELDQRLHTNVTLVLSLLDQQLGSAYIQDSGLEKHQFVNVGHVMKYNHASLNLRVLIPCLLNAISFHMVHTLFHIDMHTDNITS